MEPSFAGNVSASYVLVGAFAPYLGGPATWSPLRALFDPQARIVEVDPLSVISAADPQAALAQKIALELTSGCRIVVHGNSVKAALLAARDCSGARIVAVDPVLSDPRRAAGFRAALRAALRSGLAKGLLKNVAHKKAARLAASGDDEVRKELSLFSSEPSGELVREAAMRLREANAQALADATARALDVDLSIDLPLANVFAGRIAFVFGERSRLRARCERTVRTYFAQAAVTIAADAGAASQIDSPAAVASALL